MVVPAPRDNDLSVSREFAPWLVQIAEEFDLRARQLPGKVASFSTMGNVAVAAPGDSNSAAT